MESVNTQRCSCHRTTEWPRRNTRLRQLSIVGSDITLRTTPGKGSMFAITVPLSHVTIPRVRSKSLPRQRPGLGITAAVLVIDDEPAILDGMKHLLSGWGCTAHVALGALTFATGWMLVLIASRFVEQAVPATARGAVLSSASELKHA